MLKQYLPNIPSGATAGFWEANWEDREGASLEALRRWDPLVPHFLAQSGPGSRVLEGGCGLGHYVELLRDAGRRAVGLDFALQTLARIRGQYVRLPLIGGDVAALPFQDSCFDVYISQGVVEHFEAGPEAALAEAYRVLAPGGLLLVSVPDFNLLRRALLRGRRARRERGTEGGAWRDVQRHEVGEVPEMAFFQYVYRPAEFRGLLHTRGFHVEWDRGYSLVWGLHDLGPFRLLLSGLARRRSVLPTRGPAAAPGSASSAPTEPPRVSWKDRLRGIALREEARGPVSALVLRLLRDSCANMRLYAARKPAAA